jgi:hypothetical protein
LHRRCALGLPYPGIKVVLMAVVLQMRQHGKRCLRGASSEGIGGMDLLCGLWHHPPASHI